MLLQQAHSGLHRELPLSARSSRGGREDGTSHTTPWSQIQLATGGSSRRNCHTQSLLRLQPGHGLIRVHTAFFCTRALGPRWVQLCAPAGSLHLLLAILSQNRRLHNSECASTPLSQHLLHFFLKNRIGSNSHITTLIITQMDRPMVVGDGAQ